MKKLFGFDIEDEYFDFLFCEQTKGKEIAVENGKVVARDRVVTQEELNQNKIAELDNWFKTTYRYQCEKYTRLIALNKLDDDGVDPNKKLLELYEEAEDVRIQIQELEEE